MRINRNTQLIQMLHPQIKLMLDVGWSVRDISAFFQIPYGSMHYHMKQRDMHQHRKDAASRVHAVISGGITTDQKEIAAWANVGERYLEMYFAGKFERKIKPSEMYHDLRTVRGWKRKGLKKKDRVLGMPGVAEVIKQKTYERMPSLEDIEAEAKMRKAQGEKREQAGDAPGAGNNPADVSKR